MSSALCFWNDCVPLNLRNKNTYNKTKVGWKEQAFQFIFAISLRDILPDAVKSSTRLPFFKVCLETLYCGLKRNCWHLHDSNSHSGSLRCRLRLGQCVEPEYAHLSFVLTRWQWNRRASTSQLTLQLCIPRWSPTVCKIFLRKEGAGLCSVCCLDILLSNLNPLQIVLMLSLTVWNALTAFTRHKTMDFLIAILLFILQINFVFTFFSVVRKFCRLFAVHYPVYCVLAIFS